jgi:hypothetical protein
MGGKGTPPSRRQRRADERDIVKAFAREQGITRNGARTVFRNFIADQAQQEIARRQAAAFVKGEQE